MDSVALASYYRIHATTFIIAAHQLEDASRAKNEALPGNFRSIPFYYLTHHAAELLLKCALLKRGVDQKKLREIGLRHNLRALADDLLKLGGNLSSDAMRLIDAISDQHRDHHLRYEALFEDSRVITPPAEAMFSALEEILLAGRVSKQT